MRAIIKFANLLATAISAKNGDLLAAAIDPGSPVPSSMAAFGEFSIVDRDAMAKELSQTDTAKVAEMLKSTLPLPDDALNRMATWTPTVSMYFELVKIISLDNTNFARVHDAFGKMLDAYSALFSPWQLPLLRFLIPQFVKIAKSADAQKAALTPTSPDPLPTTTSAKLQDSVRTLQSFISPMVMDTRDFPNTRKAGLLTVINPAFQIFFSLNSFNLMAAFFDNLTSRGDLDLSRFPLSQQVVYLYYLSRWFIMENKWRRAEDGFSKCWKLLSSCRYIRQKTPVLLYLTVCRMVLGWSLPTPDLLSRYGLAWFAPSLQFYRTADFVSYRQLLDDNMDHLRSRRLYIPLRYRTTNVMLRNCLRKLHTMNNTSERSTVVRFAQVYSALKHVGFFDNVEKGEEEDVEYMMMSLIEQDYVKSYIAHTSNSVVFSSTNPFPDLKHQVYQLQDMDRPPGWNERGGAQAPAAFGGADDE